MGGRACGDLGCGDLDWGDLGSAPIAPQQEANTAATTAANSGRTKSAGRVRQGRTGSVPDFRTAPTLAWIMGIAKLRNLFGSYRIYRL